MKMTKNKVKLIIILISAVMMAGLYLFADISENSTVSHIGAIEFNKSINEKNNIILIDIRTPEEFNIGHIEGSKLINFYDRNFMNEMSKLDKKSPIYIYCRSGRRSAIAANNMKENGFQQVYNLKDGIKSWQREGFTLIK